MNTLSALKIDNWKPIFIIVMEFIHRKELTLRFDHPNEMRLFAASLRHQRLKYQDTRVRNKRLLPLGYSGLD